jgi:hypothetical protein
MKRWVDKLRQTFARTGADTAPAAEAVPASGLSAAVNGTTPPPQSTAEAYAFFTDQIEPVLRRLQSLPPDDAGLEFFTRIDVLRPDDTDALPRIDVWLFHTREGKPASRLHEAPSTHMITIESKKSRPERPDFSQLLALGETPVLRLSFNPAAEEGARLTRHTYIERYEKPQAGRKYNIYCGNYGMVIDKSPDVPLARISDFTDEIKNWLKTHAPARLPAVAHLLSPPRDINILPPANIRKRRPRT